MAVPVQICSPCIQKECRPHGARSALCVSSAAASAPQPDSRRGPGQRFCRKSRRKTETVRVKRLWAVFCQRPVEPGRVIRKKGNGRPAARRPSGPGCSGLSAFSRPGPHGRDGRRNRIRHGAVPIQICGPCIPNGHRPPGTRSAFCFSRAAVSPLQPGSRRGARTTIQSQNRLKQEHAQKREAPVRHTWHNEAPEA